MDPMTALRLVGATGFLIYATVGIITLRKGHLLGWANAMLLSFLALLSTGIFTSVNPWLRVAAIMAFQVTYGLYFYFAVIKGQLK